MQKFSIIWSRLYGSRSVDLPSCCSREEMYRCESPTGLLPVSSVWKPQRLPVSACCTSRVDFSDRAWARPDFYTIQIHRVWKKLPLTFDVVVYHYLSQSLVGLRHKHQKAAGLIQKGGTKSTRSFLKRNLKTNMIWPPAEKCNSCGLVLLHHCCQVSGF